MLGRNLSKGLSALFNTEDTGMPLNELKTFTASVIEPLYVEEQKEEQSECQTTEQDVESILSVPAVPEVVQTSEQIDDTLLRGNHWDYYDVESTYRTCYGIRNVMNMVERTLYDSFKQLKNNFGVIGKCLLFFDRFSPSLRAYTEFSDVYEYALAKFGIKKTTVCNLIRIYKEFCDTRGNLKSWYADYSVSQLFEMLPLSYGEYVKIKPDWTVAQIREYKKSLRSVQMSEQKGISGLLGTEPQESGAQAETVETVSEEKHTDIGTKRLKKAENALATVGSGDVQFVYIEKPETLMQWLRTYGHEVDWPCKLYFVKV